MSYNKISMAELVRSAPGITRAQIADRLNISKALANLHVADLVKQGWITILDRTGGRAGRKTDLLGIAGSRGAILCLSVDCISLTAHLFSLDNRVKASFQKSWKQPATQSDFLELLYPAIRELLSALPAGSDKAAMVIAFNGYVIQDYGMVLNLEGMDGWQSLSMENWFERRFSMRPLCVSQTTACLNFHTAGKAPADFLYLKLDGSMAFGAVEKGRILKGGVGTAGPLSHLGLNKKGKPCACGQQGCLETLESVPERLESIKPEILPGLIQRHHPQTVLINTGGAPANTTFSHAGVKLQIIAPTVDQLIEGAFHLGARRLLRTLI